LAQRFDGEVAEVAQQMMRVVDSASVAVRRLITNLRPLVLDDLGLAAAAKALALDLEQASGIAFDLDLGGFRPAAPLPDAHTTALYRVLQECLTNIVRHAHATEATIVLRSDPDGVRLVVADNGKGFDRSADPPRTYGLLNIGERLRRIGGTVTLDSRPGEGTRVETFLPAVRPAP
jgi:signal transduction histidine kinase